MRRREFIGSFCAAAAWSVTARAQQIDRMRRVAVLMQFAESEPEGRARAQALEQGLTSREWTIGRDVSIAYVWAVNDIEKLHEAIRDFVARPPDVIVANTSREVAELQRASRSIPIVFTTVYEPVAQGFVQSLAHPGGNATGFTTIESTVGAKWLGLLKELAPSLDHAAFIFDSNNPGPLQAYPSVEAAAKAHGVDASQALVQTAADIELAMERIARQPNAGVLVPPDGFLVKNRELIVALAARYRLPAVYGLALYAARGGLVSYGASAVAQFTQAADYVNRILRGAKPGDLPVQQPTKYDLVINLGTAKALGLTVPQTLLVTADRVIE